MIFSALYAPHASTDACPVMIGSGVGWKREWERERERELRVSATQTAKLIETFLQLGISARSISSVNI